MTRWSLGPLSHLADGFSFEGMDHLMDSKVSQGRLIRRLAHANLPCYSMDNMGKSKQQGFPRSTYY